MSLPVLPEEEEEEEEELGGSGYNLSPVSSLSIDSQATLPFPPPPIFDPVHDDIAAAEEKKASSTAPIQPSPVVSPEREEFPSLPPRPPSPVAPEPPPPPPLTITQSITQHVSTPPRVQTRSQTSSTTTPASLLDPETKYDEPPKKTPNTRRKSKPKLIVEEEEKEKEIKEEEEFVVEKVVGRYLFGGEYWYEVKWEGWPEQFNTLEQQLPTAMKKPVVPPILNSKQKKQVKAITELLKIHCDTLDSDEREVYSRTWVNHPVFKDAYTRALGVAKLHKRFWYVSNTTEENKAKIAEAKIESYYPRSDEFKCCKLVRPGEMPQNNNDDPEEEDIEGHYEDPEEDAVVVVSDDVKEEEEEKKKEPLWSDPIILNYEKKEIYPYPTESMDEVFRVGSDKKRKEDNDRILFHRRFNEEDKDIEINPELKQLYEQSVSIEQKEINSFNFRNIAILDSEIHSVSEVNSLSQICAVSLDGNKVFNRYIRHVIGGAYLHAEWLELVGSYVDLEPSDDPEKAETFPSVMIQFCQYWPPGTLFLYKGHADYSFLVLNFRVHFELMEDPQIIEAIQKFAKSQYRFQSADKVFAMQSIPVDLMNTKTVAALDVVYKEIFYRSLLFSSELSSFVYDKDIRADLNDEFKLLISPSFHGKYDRNPPAQWEKVDIWYWTSGSLGPVWHSAHTDALMLRNCLLAVMIFYLLATTQKKKQATKPELLVIWKEIMTAIVAKTTVFRSFHLGSSIASAQLLGNILIDNAEAFDNSRYIAVRIHNSIVGKTEINLSDENVETFGNKTKFVTPTYSSPERGRAYFNATHGEKINDNDGHIQDTKKVDVLYSFQVFDDVMVSTANTFTDSTALKETLKLLIIEKHLKIEGEGSKLPPEYQFFRTDMQNYLEYLQNNKAIKEKDKRWFQTHPCFTKAGTSSTVRFPKTYLLHHQDCPELNIKSKDTPLTASQSTISINDFTKHPVYSYRFRFCKKCKKWTHQKPIYEPNKYGIRAELKEQREEESKLEEIRQEQRSTTQAIEELKQIRVKQEVLPQQQSQPPQVIQLQPIIQIPPNLVSRQQSKENNNKSPQGGGRPLVGLPRYSRRNARL